MYWTSWSQSALRIPEIKKFITIWNTLKWRGLTFILCSWETGHASPKGVTFLIFTLLFMVIFIVWPAGRNSWALLLNVCQLLSHQLVYPGLSGQQCVCTMWLCLQPQASYSLSFPDLSHAHSHQSVLCNSMPRFLVFFPTLSLLAFGWPDCVTHILYTRLSWSVLHYTNNIKNRTSLACLSAENLPGL